MTQQEKVKWLAENVINPVVEECFNIDKMSFSNIETWISLTGWNPYKSWSDFGMLIEKTNKDGKSIEVWNNHFNPETKVNEWRCRIYIPDDGIGLKDKYINVYHADLKECVTEAIFKALYNGGLNE